MRQAKAASHTKWMVMSSQTRLSTVVRSRAGRLLGAGAAMALTGPLFLGGVAQADVAVPSRSGVFKVTGSGFGHGWGMSQYGAYGAATRGLSWRQILAFYYPGTVLERQAAGTTLRVRIVADSDGDLRIRPSAGLTIKDASGHAYAVPTGSSYRTWRITRSGSGFALASQNSSGSWVSHRTGLAATTWTASTSAKIIKIVMPSGAIREYRGSASLIKYGSGARAINKVTMEDYLRSVVPAEMPTSWAPEAVRAQAVAARSYATKLKEWAAASGSASDICDTTACQVYAGYAVTYRGSRTVRETAAGNAAIAATAGQILTYHGRPALTQFASSNGGHSAQGDYPYLSSHPDPYDGVIKSQVWSRTLSASSIARIWPSVGTVRQLLISARDGGGRWGGRVQTIKIIGSGRTLSVSGKSFQSAFGLRSNLFTVGGAADRSTTPPVTSPPVTPSPVTTKPGKSYATFARSYGSGSRADLLLIDPDGRLLRFPIKGATLGSAVAIGSGFGDATHVINAGDWNGDGYQDVIVRTRAGRLLLARGSKTGKLRAGVDMKFTGRIRNLTGIGDVNGDRFPDLAVITKVGNLWLYYGDGKAGRKAKKKIAAGWNDHDWLRAVGDWNRDGRPDLVSRVGDTLWLHRGTATGFAAPISLGNGWSAPAAITSVGDFDGDGKSDIVARTPGDQLLLYRGNGSTGISSPTAVTGSYRGTRFVV
jgi:stage II sporulation protein D